MITLNVSLVQIQSFMLIFLRVGAILFSAPIFDNRGAPVLFKIGLILSISLLIYPLINIGEDKFDTPLVMLFLLVMSEIAVGLIIGFAVRTIFIGVQLAGQISGFQMGMAIANVIDPASSLQVPILSQFFNLFAILIFLSSNAHHWFVKALADSFTIIPPFEYHLNSTIVTPILTLVGNIFVVAIKVSAPIIVSLLLTTVALGLLARTVPQMHIFVVAMPLKILVGLFFFGLTLPLLVAYLKDLFAEVGPVVFGLMKLLM